MIRSEKAHKLRINYFMSIIFFQQQNDATYEFGCNSDDQYNCEAPETVAAASSSGAPFVPAGTGPPQRQHHHHPPSLINGRVSTTGTFNHVS